jgi:hypothetical protein
VKLLENTLNKVTFRETNDVLANSQQPPGTDSRKARDIVTKYTTSGSPKPKILCSNECKQTKKTTDHSLKVVKKQALIHIKEHPKKSKDPEPAHACTARGAHPKLQKHSKNQDKLVASWDTPPGPGCWEEYKDAGVNEDGDVILHFQTMLAVGPEPRQGQSSADLWE